MEQINNKCSGVQSRVLPGFTLIELIVTIFIVAMVAAFGVPRYFKTVEQSKATDAFINLKHVALANQTYKVTNNVYTSGLLKYVEDGQQEVASVYDPTPGKSIPGTCTRNGACQSGSSPSDSSSSDSGQSACNLLYCAFMGKQDWGHANQSWNYWSCDPLTGSGGGCCTKGYVACTARVFDGSPYSNWGYGVTMVGTAVPLGGAPTRP